MKRLAPWIACLALFALVVAPAWAAASGTSAPETKTADKSPVAPYATAISTVTGVAISPMLGTAGLGVYQRMQAKDDAAKAKLPWYAQWSFIVPALLLVGVVAAKDSLGAVVPPGMKKPLDVLETIENKASGLVAAGAVVPFTMSSLSKMIVASAPAGSGDVLLHSGTATVALGAIDWSWLLNLLTIPIGIAVFAIVWLASHAINALILLSPWGAIDAVLKGARTALLGLITLTATLSPWVSAILSLVVIVVAYLVAGWAFRLTVFGAIFSWDFLTLRKSRFTVAASGANKLFSSNTLTEQGVPMRTYGQLQHDAARGEHTFRYRPWLVLPEKTVTVKLSPTAAVGKGLFISSIQDGERTAFVLPPRYRGHEQAMVEACALGGGVRDAGLLKAWGALKELFGGSSSRTQVA
jgi:MFS family permease